MRNDEAWLFEGVKFWGLGRYWVFVAAGLLSSCGAWASGRAGFSCCGAWAPGARASVAGVLGSGAQAQ